MRSLPLLLVLATTPAYADSFVGATGGVMIPLGDSNSSKTGWTDEVSSSPKIGVRVGSIGESNLGGMLTADWTPISANASNQLVDISAQRFRILAHVVFEKRVAPMLTLAFRGGGGIDIAHASASSALGDASDTDVGWAFELGGGVWWSIGEIDIGGEVALPFGGHSHKASKLTDVTIDYTSYDLDLLFGVRLRSK